MNTSLINQLKLFFYEFKKFDKKIFYIFIFTAIIHTISWYYVSRSFFNEVIDPRNSLNNLYEFLYWFIGDSLLLFTAPVLLIIFKFKEKLSAYGFSLKERKFGFQIILIFFFFIFTGRLAFNFQRILRTKSSLFTSCKKPYSNFCHF